MVHQDPIRKSKYGNLAIFYIAFAAVLFMYVTPGYGQKQLYLQHQHKSHRQENISLNKEYTFQTSDSIYNEYRIIAFSKSNLLIGSISRQDTLQLTIEDIERIIKVKGFGLFEAIGTLGVMCMTSTPGLWVTGEGEEASDLFLISSFLLTVSVPIIAV